MNDPEDPVTRTDRRSVLGLLNAVGVASLAGCLSGDGGGTEPAPTDTDTVRSATSTSATDTTTSRPTSTATATPVPDPPAQLDVVDGFETGDYRNFTPLYVGSESSWIRPQATIISEDPISGEHSLRWSANQDPQRWVLVSNAFQLNPPIEASVSVRIDDRRIEEYAVGIAIAESQADAAVLRTTFSGLELATDTWDGDPVDSTEDTLQISEPYELSIGLSGGTVTGVVRDEAGTELARVSGDVALEPNVIALYVDTAAGAETTVTFDDVRVTGDPYRVRAGEWTRAQPFVVLDRPPELTQDQGNWVGAQDVIKEDDRYRMWYRIRSNQGRGQGFGYAESQDGYDWEKSNENPVIVPDFGQDSMEGITVLNVDGTYHALYCIDNGPWNTVHATSQDGIDWTDHEIVVDRNAKDPMAAYVNGTYYMYLIAGSDFLIYTSSDAINWTHENTIPTADNVHSHPSIYYVEETETFWLYAFVENGGGARPARVRRAPSEDGINFDELTETWHDPLVGLDHRPIGGIDYGSFATDGHQHLPHDRRLPMYYQSRHNYTNNPPDWQHTGDGVITLAGQFSGLFEGVATHVDGDAYDYHEFPLEAASIADLDVEATDPATITVDSWTPAATTAATGTVRTETETTITVSASALAPAADYTLGLGDVSAGATTDGDGAASFELAVPPDTATGFELARGTDDDG